MQIFTSYFPKHLGPLAASRPYVEWVPRLFEGARLFCGPHIFLGTYIAKNIYFRLHLLMLVPL